MLTPEPVKLLSRVNFPFPFPPLFPFTPQQKHECLYTPNRLAKVKEVSGLYNECVPIFVLFSICGVCGATGFENNQVFLRIG